MTLENRYVVQRFILKAIILTIFASLQWRRGILLTVAMLFGFTSMMDVGLA
jgi:hypothetical protein